MGIIDPHTIPDLGHTTLPHIINPFRADQGIPHQTLTTAQIPAQVEDNKLKKAEIL